MRVYFLDDDGRLRPGDDRGIRPEDVTYSLDAAGCCVIGRIERTDGRVWALRTCLAEQTRGQAELRIYEALRVEVARENPIKEDGIV